MPKRRRLWTKADFAAARSAPAPSSESSESSDPPSVAAAASALAARDPAPGRAARIPRSRRSAGGKTIDYAELDGSDGGGEGEESSTDDNDNGNDDEECSEEEEVPNGRRRRQASAGAARARTRTEGRRKRRNPSGRKVGGSGKESTRSKAAARERLKLREHWERVWDAKFVELREFKSREGHCLVPQTNKTLGSWVSCQRVEYNHMQQGKAAYITEERIERLKTLGFVWDGRTFDDAWNEKYEELRAYKSRRGDCYVSTHDDENKALGAWVVCQRRSYSHVLRGMKTYLTEERIERLEALGFSWDAMVDVWNEKFEKLRAYKLRRGHCQVRWSDDANLYRWVRHLHLRRARKERGVRSFLTEEQERRLESLGFWTER